jgi:Fic family protein
VQFETIHPFMDGNGRLGRLIIPLILVEAGLFKEPLLYLSLFFKKHRQTYYDRLNQIRLSGDWENWLQFFVDAIAETANQAVETAKALNELHNQHRKQVAGIGRLSGSATQVLAALFNYPIASIAKLVEATSLSPATVGKVMDTLENELKIVKEQTGQKRNRLYVYSEYLSILNQHD